MGYSGVKEGVLGFLMARYDELPSWKIVWLGFSPQKIEAEPICTPVLNIRSIPSMFHAVALK